MELSCCAKTLCSLNTGYLILARKMFDFHNSQVLMSFKKKLEVNKPIIGFSNGKARS